MKLKIEWTTKKDHPYILEIEKECYSDPWDQATLTKFLNARRNIGMTVRVNNDVVGYYFYQLCDGHYDLVSLTVHPAWQRSGIGRAMMDELKAKLGRTHKRSSIHMNVSERCENSHFFLRSMGFRAVKVERDYFKVGEQFEDAYHFRYDLGKPYRHERREKVCCVENEMGQE